MDKKPLSLVQTLRTSTPVRARLEELARQSDGAEYGICILSDKNNNLEWYSFGDLDQMQERDAVMRVFYDIMHNHNKD